MRYSFTVIAVVLLLITGCSRGGNILLVKPIDGPDSLSEGVTATYSVDASGDTGITYTWAVAPATAGSFSDQGSSSVLFAAADVDSDLTVTIRVVVNSDRDGPVVREKEVLIEYSPPEEPEPDENHSPTASAYTWLTRLTPGSDVQFYSDSDDPDGIDDIVKYEWDFSFDMADGFVVESEEKNPIFQFPDEGTHLIHMRVTDSGGLTDWLDTPLEINVVSNVGWAIAWGGTEDDSGRAVDVDNYGNIYTCGRASADIDFDPGPGVFTHDGGQGYVNRINPDGSLEWAYSLGTLDSSSNRGYPYDIAVTNWDTVSVVGYFTGSVDFDPGPDVLEVQTVDSGAFLQTIGVDGSLHWIDVELGNSDYYYGGTYQWWSTTGYYYESIYFDDLGNRYLVRSYWYSYHMEGHGGIWEDENLFGRSLIRFTPGGDSHTYFNDDVNIHRPVAISLDGYVFVFLPHFIVPMLSAFAPDTSDLWSYYDEEMEIWDVSCMDADSSNNVYITGWLNVYPEPDSSFVRKFDVEGNILWTSRWGGPSYDDVTGVAVSVDGSIYIIGTFEGTVDFVPGSDVFYQTAKGDFDYYLLKLAPNGDFQWLRTWGGMTIGEPEDVHVVTDHLGDVIVLGNFSGAIDLKPGPEQQFFTSTGETDIYLIKFAPDGNW